MTFGGAVAGTVYSWTNTGDAITGLAASGTASVTSSVLTNTTGAAQVANIVVTTAYTNDGVTCPGGTTSFTITVNPNPTVNTVSSEVICSGSSNTAVTFGGAVAGTVYSWTNTGDAITGLPSSGTASVTAAVLTNTTGAAKVARIVVTTAYTNAGVTCNGGTTSYTITVHSAPSATTSGATSVCVGATTPLSASGTWFGANWVSLNPEFATVSASGIVTGVAAGTTTITLTLTSEFSCTAVYYFPMQVVGTVGNPSAPSGLTTICQGTASGTYTTTATYATSYAWSVTGTGNSISGTSTTGTVTWAAGFSGSAVVSVTATNSCGTSTTATTTVTVIPTVGTPTAPAGTTTRCQGSGTSAFTTSATNATSYNWSVTGTGNSVSGTSTTGTVTWAAGFNGSAVVSVTATNSCGTSTSTSTSITVTPTVGNPTTPSGPINRCQASGTNSFTTSATNATSYTWYISPSGAGSISGTTATGTVTWNSSFSGDATISVVANGCGTAGSISSTVTVYPMVGTPSAPSGSTLICQGTASGTYTTTATYADSYTWTLTPSSAGSIGGSTTVGTVTWNPAFTGSATILVAASNGCGTATSTATTVMVNANPVVTASYSPQPLCVGATMYLTATPDLQTRYTWTGPNSFGNIGPNSVISLNNVTTLNNGVYYVTVLGTNGCSATASTTVVVSETVGTPAAITVGSGTEPTCQLTNGTTTTTYTTTAAFASGYNWSISNLSAGAINPTTGVMAWANGFYGTVSILASANGCSGPSATVSRTVTITPLVGTPTTPSGTTSRCQGAGTSAYTTLATSATTYAWSVTGTGNSISGTSTTGTVTWAAGFSGTAIVSVIASNTCGSSASSSISVSVTPTVGTPSAPSGLTTICQGTASGTYTTTATNATSYTWYVTGTGNSISGTSTTGTITWSPTFNGNANITVVSNGCGTATSTVTTVYVTPTAGTPSAPSGITSRCQGAGTDSFTTTATNATSYTWSVSGTGNSISGTSTTGTVTWGSTFNGTALISVFANGCGTSATASSAVSVTPAPDVTATSNTPVCEGGVLILTSSSTAPNTNYAWTGPSSFIYSGPNTEITFSPMAAANAGTYTLTVTAPGYCSVTKTVLVTLALPTVPGTLASNQTICAGTQPASITWSGSTGAVTSWQVAENAAFTVGVINYALANNTITGSVIGVLNANRYVRATVQSGTCTAVYSPSVLITVTPTIVVGTLSASQTICQGTSPATMTAGAPSGTAPTYLWQSSLNNVSFDPISGATTATYQPGNLSATTYYRVAESSTGTCGGPTVTNVVTITVTPTLVAGSLSASQTICAGTSPTTMTAGAPNGTAPTYVWQSSLNNVTFSPITGATTSTYQPGNMTTTTYYKVTENSTGTCGGPLATNVISITVTPTLVVGSVSANQTICTGTSPATMTVGAPNGTAPQYVWSSSSNNVTFTPISGATTATYQPGSLSATTYYRVSENSTGTCGGPLNTGVITITVNPNLIVGSISANQTIVAGNVPAQLAGTAPNGTGPSYQWQISYNNSTFSNITGATSLTYQPGALTTTTYYRQSQNATGACGGPLNTNVVTITVTYGTIAGYVNYNNTYATGLNSVNVRLKTPGTGGALIATAVTGPDGSGTPGYYLFTGVAPGNYRLVADFPTGVWGGNNATDALIISLNTIGSWPLYWLRDTVADVNIDHVINSTDALYIKERVAGNITSYPAGDWKFTDTTVTHNLTSNVNLKGLCVGDVNGSYANPFKEASFLSAVEDEVITVPVNQSFTYDIKSNAVAQLGAMTLFMNYDETRFSVDKVVTPVEGLSYRIESGRVAIAWSNTRSLSLNPDETIISLKMTAKELMPEPVQVFAINSGSEFADPSARRLNDFDLKMAKVITSASDLSFSMINYPNPFRNFTEIVYTIPVDGKVKLVVTNMFGQAVRTLVDEQQAAGTYKVKVKSDDGYLQPGLYLYTIEVDGATATFNKTNKMLFTR